MGRALNARDSLVDSRISAGMGPSVRVLAGKRAMKVAAVRRLRAAEGSDRLPARVKIRSVAAVHNWRKTGKLYPVLQPLPAVA